MVDQDSPPITPSQPPDEGDAIDRALVARIRTQGVANRAAWADLLARYQDRLFAICYRMVGNRETAADLTQDAFVKVLQGLDTWDGRSKLSTWIIRVTMNLCLSHLRAAKLRRHAALDEGLLPSLVRGVVGTNRSSTSANMADRELPPDESVQSQDQRRRVLAALAALEPDQRAIIVLRDVQGLDYDQIAAALEVATGTVKSRLFRARTALRELIESSAPPSDP